ncbi:Similar to Lip3: Lipase 3 (Drosophila melanogaster) [Cotesia congregata]|uniref:Lipase n=1 Tax=Cotesia congregata TaxID=51543 RepID=A0A8J2E3Z6_COTCN|nr:Similar to Lip3: Lipase 3 (Drosophila melanogaster) [Cotesia congregata]
MNYILLFIALILPANVSCFLRELLFPRKPILNRVRTRDSLQVRLADDTAVLDFVGLVQQYNYPAEEHNLTTKDGYNLIIHRIPDSPKSKSLKKKSVVFLQHGVFGSSDSWVLIGPDKDLAFILADQGYDVWIGNVRGNSYCRSHQELSTSDRDFWKFSYHEIAIFDVAEMIDYVLNETNEKSLTYIGHSMGSTVSLVLLSEKPEYNEKIKLLFNLAPVAYWNAISQRAIYSVLVKYRDLLKKFLETIEVYDLMPQSSTNKILAKEFCRDNLPTQEICVALIFANVGISPHQLNKLRSCWKFSYESFSQYDYGYIDNFKIYGKKRPPAYNLKKITTNVALIYSDNDYFTPVENVLELKKRLPNIVFFGKIDYDTFNHLDYLFAQDAKELLYNRITKLISQY